MNIAFGLLLQDRKTNAISYFWCREHVGHVEGNESYTRSEIAYTWTIRHQNDMEQAVHGLKDMPFLFIVNNEFHHSNIRVLRLRNMKVTLHFANGPYSLDTADEGKIPTFLKNSKKIITLLKERNEQTSVSTDDTTSQQHKCFFKCLARRYQLQFTTPKSFDKLTNDYYERYKRRFNISDQDFCGVTLDQLPYLEFLLKIKIKVFTGVFSNNTSDLEQLHLLYYTSHNCDFGPQSFILNIFLWENHICLITNLGNLTKNCICSTCSKPFTRANSLRRHQNRQCSKIFLHSFKKGCLQQHVLLMEQIRNTFDTPDEILPQQMKFTKYFMTFDFESMLEKQHVTNDTEQQQQNHPLSNEPQRGIELDEEETMIFDDDSSLISEADFNQRYAFENYITVNTPISYAIADNFADDRYHALDEQLRQKQGKDDDDVHVDDGIEDSSSEDTYDTDDSFIDGDDDDDDDDDKGNKENTSTTNATEINPSICDSSAEPGGGGGGGGGGGVIFRTHSDVRELVKLFWEDVKAKCRERMALMYEDYEHVIQHIMQWFLERGIQINFSCNENETAFVQISRDSHEVTTKQQQQQQQQEHHKDDTPIYI